MATVGDHEDTDTGTELRVHLVQLVVEHLAIPEHPGLVAEVDFVAVRVVDVAPVAGVGDQTDVAGPGLVGEAAQFADDGLGRRLAVDQLAGLEALGGGELHHRVRVVDAPRQPAVPTAVGVRVDGVEADVE